MSEMPEEFSEQWIEWRQRVDLSGYDARWERLASRGENIYGEADFICQRLEPSATKLIMDAGCGSGRVGIELARRGFSVVGVDNDPDMLALAQAKTETDLELSKRVHWELSNLAEVKRPEKFDVVALAGNVLVFAKPEARQVAINNLAAQLKPGGLLIAGSSFAHGYDFDLHRKWCEAVGLEMVDCYATWDEDPYQQGDYSVSVFRQP